MKMTEPREGYRSTIIMEMVDPGGEKMSDIEVNWYGGVGEEGKLFHNTLQNSIVSAVSALAQRGAEEVAKGGGGLIRK